MGLLMLQSQLHAGKGPALYLCPNHFFENDPKRLRELPGAPKVAKRLMKSA